MRQIIVAALLLFIPFSSSAKEQCVDWPLVMQLQQLQNVHPNEPTLILKNFENATGEAGDDWASQGIPLLLHRYLSTEEKWNLYSQDQTAYLKSFPEKFYRIEGMFQHTEQTLRIFVQLKDAQGKLITQIPIKTPYLRHTHFFESLKEAAVTLLKELGVKNPNSKEMDIIQNETRDIFAFSNYVKGVSALKTYDPNHIEVANIWFQEAYREDPKYPLPYLGLIDSYAFLYLYNKQSAIPYQHILESVLNTERAMIHKKVRHYFNAPTEKELKKRKHHSVIRAQPHYIAGKRAFENGNFQQAIKELNDAFEILPEDSMSAYTLGESYAKVGNAKKAKEYLDYAKGINRCLKK